MGENPKKYHVTDDGDVYRVNEDGSFTSMGNAENMSSATQTEQTKSQSPKPSSIDKPIKPFIEKKHRGLVIGVIISVFLLGGSSLFYLLNSQKISNISKEDGLSLDAVAQSVSEESLAENEQQITEEQSVISQDNSQSEITKAESHQLSQPIVKETDQVSENYVKSSDNTNNANSARKGDDIEPNKIYSAVEVQADFPGGDRARRQWLRDNIQWPRDANGQQLHGEVELDFVIERDGSISNVKVTYSENTDLNTAAIRLISSMPKWSPAMVKNQPVRSPMGITLFF